MKFQILLSIFFVALVASNPTPPPPASDVATSDLSPPIPTDDGPTATTLPTDPPITTEEPTVENACKACFEEAQKKGTQLNSHTYLQLDKLI